MSELVLYGLRLLAKQFLGTILDIEVDQSGLVRLSDTVRLLWHCGGPRANTTYIIHVAVRECECENLGSSPDL